AQSLELDGVANGTAAGLHFRVHEPLVPIVTLQEFVDAVNQSGVLGGHTLQYDPATQTFTIPLSFAMDLGSLPQFQNMPIDLGFDFGSSGLATLTTSAVANLSASVSGHFDLIIDFHNGGTPALWINN